MLDNQWFLTDEKCSPSRSVGVGTSMADVDYGLECLVLQWLHHWSS